MSKHVVWNGTHSGYTHSTTSVGGGEDFHEGPVTIHTPEGENLDWYLEWFNLFGFFW
jgi:hypothetical protein